MAKNSAASLLTSVDSLFTTQAERDEAERETVITLSPKEISDFPGHPFKVRMDESMAEMVESVRQYGVLVPALVRQTQDGNYEMVAGHRRKLACELAGKELPCLVRDLTDDEATIIMVDSNLQREQILPSEKAFAYKMKLEAMKRQGQRTDLTLSPTATKLDTAAKLGQQSGESRDQVFRYIRLTYLINLCWIWWTMGKSPCARLWSCRICPKMNSSHCWKPWNVRIAPRPMCRQSKCGSSLRREN